MIRDTQSAQISQKQDECKLVEHSLVHWYQQCVTIHHVPKCMSCHKAIVVITGRAYCFHDSIYIYIYDIYIYILYSCNNCIYLSLFVCVVWLYVCVFNKVIPVLVCSLCLQILISDIFETRGWSVPYLTTSKILLSPCQQGQYNDAIQSRNLYSGKILEK